MSRRFTPFNRLSIEVYDSGTTLLNDPDFDMKRAAIDGFRKQYPGGICADGSFYVPRPVLRAWLVKGAQRVVFRNGHEAAYEGWISDLGYFIGETEQGVNVPLVNGVDQFLSNWTLRKPWADTRIDEQTWPVNDWLANAKYNFLRNNELKMYPKALAFGASAEYGVIGYYNIPTGQTIKRVTFHYVFAEAGQNWLAKLRDTTNASDLWGPVSADASGDVDATVSPASTQISFNLYNGAAQTAPGDDTVHLTITNLTVYTETGSINMEEIAKDLRAFVTDVNSDEQYIAAAGTARSLVPYIVTGHMSAADILQEVTNFGDGATPPNRWAWGLYHSEKAATPDGKPVLFLEQYPDTSDYDYVVKLGGPNLAADVEIDRDYGAVQNWISVRYTDANGWEQWVTPDDDATLKDDDSIAAYGRRSVAGGLDVGSMTQANAIAYGVRYKNTYKSPPWKLLRPIEVYDYILDKQGIEVPASLIEPGKRVKVEGWPEDETGAGITFVITGTDYRHAGRPPCALAAGGLMAPFLPRQLAIPSMGGAAAGSFASMDTGAIGFEELVGGGGGERERLNVKRRMGLKPGTAAWDAMVKMTGGQRRAAWKAFKMQRRKRG